MLEYILERVAFALKSKLSEDDKRLIYDEISYAIGHTKSHIAITRKDGIDKQSTILANIWLRASSNINSIKDAEVQSLITTIREKSRYWYDPESYDDALLDTYNMRIVQVESKLEQLCEH